VEKRQRYLRSLLNVIEEGLSRSLRDKDLEMEKVNRRNMELEERVKQLKLEAHLWQSKARNHEAMVATLKSNLQQAVVQSKEQNREGCGDNEADDAESAHVDPNVEVNYAKPPRGSKDPRDQITCKICRKNAISILLLPCRHLCLCRDCEMTFDTCPVCHAIKNASVEVYMS
jgi:E3 ubiquitin-protein ligase BOI-like protein